MITRDINQLAVAAKGGDEQAFLILLEQLRPQIYRHCRQYLRHLPPGYVGEDMSSIINTSIWEFLQAWRNEGSAFNTFAVRSMANKLVSFHLHAHRGKRHGEFFTTSVDPSSTHLTYIADESNTFEIVDQNQSIITQIDGLKLSKAQTITVEAILRNPHLSFAEIAKQHGWRQSRITRHLNEITDLAAK